MARMTSIRVDEEVYRDLERRIQSFSDTPNVVLRRLLGLDSGVSTRVAEAAVSYRAALPLIGFRRGRPTLAQPNQTPQREFSRPLLEALVELGGEASAKDVLDRLGQKLMHVLKASDYERLSNGEPRWRVTSAFERKNLVERGLMDRRAPRGRWRITDAGREWLTQRQVGAGAPEWDLEAGLKVAERVVRDNKKWLQEMATR